MQSVPPRTDSRREKFEVLVKELEEKAEVRMRNWRKENFYKCFVDTMEDAEGSSEEDILYMISTLFFRDKVLVKSDLLRPYVLKEIGEAEQIRNSFESNPAELLANYKRHINYFENHNLEHGRKMLSQVVSRLAIPINDRKVNVESKFVRHLRRADESSGDGDDLHVLHPLPMYKYEEGFMLDQPVWKNQDGSLVTAYKTGGRTCSSFEGREVVQQKGSFLSKIPLGKNSNSDQPMGALTFVNGQTEYDNVKMIGKDVLKYEAKLYDLGEFKPSNGHDESYDLCILERRADTRRNNIHLRINHVLSEDSSSLKEKIGIDINESFERAGKILRKAHENGVFPLNYHLGNISVDGYPLDFEGSPNKYTMRDYLGMMPGSSIKTLKEDGLESLLKGLLGTSLGRDYVYGFVSGYTGLDDVSKIVPEKYLVSPTRLPSIVAGTLKGAM